MKGGRIKEELKKQLKALLNSMDFVSEHFLDGKKMNGREFSRFFRIYQQLGLAWEFLGLQCKHWDGYRKTRDKKEICKICGKVKGVDDSYILLSNKGPKKLGVKLKPNSKKTFETKKDAEIVSDMIDFYGALVNVDVHNSYKSTVLGKGINIAAERIVNVKEGNVVCSIDQRLIHIRMRDNDIKAGKKKYGGFPWEIRRKDLKHFPVLFDFDEQHRFLGLTIFK
ncbi:MAG: hypothetical protein ACLQGU_03045 [bacterium]